MQVETETMILTDVERNSQSPPSLDQINQAITVLIRGYSTGTLNDLFDEGHFGEGLMLFIDANSPAVQQYLRSVNKDDEYNKTQHIDGLSLFGASLTAVCMNAKGKTLLGQMLADNLKGALAVAFEKLLQDADHFLEIIEEVKAKGRG